MKKRGLQLLGGALAIAMLSTVLQVPTAYAAEAIVETEIIPSKVIRVSGATRYETSIKTAEQLKKSLGVTKFDSVIIASGTGFADALAGSYLANVKSAPILMTDGKNITQLKRYIDSNLSDTGVIYILGGEKAVPKAVEEAFPADDYNVNRISGATRYETNIKILEAAEVTGEDLLVCTGDDFADSLSGSAVGKPILLVGKSLTKSQQTFLETADVDQIYVIGGSAAVSEKVIQSLEKYDADEKVVRVSGSNRYKTSIAVAEEFFAAPDYAVLAYARNFPDGLCAGPLAYSKNAPLLLTQTGKEDVTAEYTNTIGIGRGAVLGGSKLISDEAAKKIFASTTQEEESEKQQYTVRVSTTLHRQPATASTYIEVPYMTEVTFMENMSPSERGMWAKVQYQGQIYYIWQATGTEYLTDEKSTFSYTSDDPLQQEVIDKALNIYLYWDTKYAHEQSTGIKDTDGKYGFDCSGFVAFVMDEVMKDKVPTYDLSAHLSTLYKTKSVYNQGLKGEFVVQTIQTGTLDESKLQPGDVLFFKVGVEESYENLGYNHCGIYLGNGEFIHCTRSWGGGVGIMPLSGIYADGFVAAKRYLPEEILSADNQRYANSQKTYVYSSRDSEQDSIDVLPAETPVVVQFTDNGNWAYVNYGTDQKGFILEKYLDDQLVEISQTMYVKKTSLKLYSEYTTNSNYVEVPIGTEVEYKGRYSNSSYYKVLYEDAIYYVYAPDTAGGISDRLTEDYEMLMNGIGEIQVTKNTYLRISMDSKIDDNIIQLMREGDQAVLIAQSDSTTWCYIKLENEICGYVLTKYISITKNY